MSQPNIIERLQQIDWICTELVEDAQHKNNANVIIAKAGDIEGIVGEILTMIDGR